MKLKGATLDHVVVSWLFKRIYHFIDRLTTFLTIGKQLHKYFTKEWTMCGELDLESVAGKFGRMSRMLYENERTYKK